jgi:hypothetical protein
VERSRVGACLPDHEREREIPLSPRVLEPPLEKGRQGVKEECELVYNIAC